MYSTLYRLHFILKLSNNRPLNSHWQLRTPFAVYTFIDMSYKLLTTHTHSSKFTWFELKHYFSLTGLSTSAICILRHKSRGHLPFYRLKVQKPGKQSIERKSSFPSTKTSSEPWKTINRKNVFLSIDKKFKNLENNQSKECLPFHRRKSSKTWKTINRKNVFLSIDETVQKPGKKLIERMSSFPSTKKFKNPENNQSKECLPFHRRKSSNLTGIKRYCRPCYSKTESK